MRWPYKVWNITWKDCLQCRRPGLKIRKILGQEDPLEKGMTTHSSILAWEIPWQATAHGIAKSWT